MVVHSIQLLGKTICTAAIVLTEERIKKFLKNLKLPSIVNLLQLFLGFVNFYRQYIPRLVDKLVLLHLMLQKVVPFNSTQDPKDAILEINECLLKASKMSLKLPLPEKQIVIMFDAGENAYGFVLLFDDYVDEETGETSRLAPVAFGSKRFTTGEMSLTMYGKHFLVRHVASDVFRHIMRELKNL